MINSQLGGDALEDVDSISKGIDDQFSAEEGCVVFGSQYIKGD